jgi:hypothetical protein
VAHFIEEERQREGADSRERSAAARQHENVEFHLRNLVDLLRTQVAGDVDAFSREFPDRAVTFETGPSDGGFTVRRGHYPHVQLVVEPNMNTGSIVINYVVASETGTQALTPKFLDLGGHTSSSLHFRDEPEQRAFRTIAQLSEYLLVPVFTGRPR